MPVATFLVEDSPTIREQLIPALLELANVRVVGIAEGEGEAKQWLEAHGATCRLAVIDLFLKEGSGFGVIAACKDKGTPPHIVMLSNYATAEMRRQALALGADAVFDKSTELMELFAYCSRIGATSNLR
ncbi:response regulator [Variovorax saccharolyticus]|uniref:response regulator n=1 Tax=Variovorax saccharolyticus TaxID=3053516 RepID=UPI00257576B4|nr:response regulator [Variovorax sp. J31P216]MDM0029576.1 response regulator [Variovorax sp. J31P216]